jgi:DNA ligase 1
MTFRPTLAVDASWEDFKCILDRGDLLYASPKLDGIRATVIDGRLVSRTLKPIRNRYIQGLIGLIAFHGLDGELVVGDAFGEGVFARTSSGVMSEFGQPNFTYHIFDNFGLGGGYRWRHEALKITSKGWLPEQMKLLEQTPIKKLEELEAFEDEVVEQGYEGAIVRWSEAPYKQGRSTLRERYMLKLKRFKDGEAKIVGFGEMMHNDNEAKIDGRGLTTRGHSQANKRPSGTLGQLYVQDLHRSEWEFGVGTGFDAALRQEIWNKQDAYLGRIIKYRYLPVGTKDLPRHPTFQGFRHQDDI